METPKPLVSICCITYNHEPYIRECLEGFMMQKTNFPFEVLIHDDASTDGTADIIREYEAKYPGIIKPIYQTINQYSQGKNIWGEIQFPAAQGKYIAVCEGDDFWCDPEKLQKQVDFLEKHPDYSVCTCACCVLDEIHHYVLKGPKHDFSKFSTTRELQTYIVTVPHLPSTASLVFRFAAWQQIKYSFLQDSQDAPMGDFQLFFHLAKQGKMHFLNDCMTVYRMHLNSASVFNSEKEKKFIEKCAAVKANMLKRDGRDDLITLIPHFVASCDKKKTLKSQLKSLARRIMRHLRGNYHIYQKYLSKSPVNRIHEIYTWSNS